MEEGLPQRHLGARGGRLWAHIFRQLLPRGGVVGAQPRKDRVRNLKGGGEAELHGRPRAQERGRR